MSTFPIFPSSSCANHTFPSFLSSSKLYACPPSGNSVNFSVLGSNRQRLPPLPHRFPRRSIRTLPAPPPNLSGAPAICLQVAGGSYSVNFCVSGSNLFNLHCVSSTNHTVPSRASITECTCNALLGVDAGGTLHSCTLPVSGFRFAIRFAVQPKASQTFLLLFGLASHGMRFGPGRS